MKRSSFAARVKSRRKPTRPRGVAPAPSAASGNAAQAPASGAGAPPPSPAKRASTRPAKAKPQAEPDEGFVAVGRALAPFGLKGELRVQPLSDNPARFRPRARLWAGPQLVTVEASREAQGYVYLTLRGFRDRTSVEKFRHALLQVPEGDLPPLGESQYYRFQLLGLAVAGRDGAEIGTLAEIIETGANDVYRVRTTSGTDVLLPALADVIVSVDLAARRMVVDPPTWR